MLHTNTLTTTERLEAMRDLHARSLGLPWRDTPLVCGYCYAVREPDTDTCPCGRAVWLTPGGAVALLELAVYSQNTPQEAVA